MKIYLCKPKPLLLLLTMLTISCTSLDDEFEESNSLESTTQMQSHDVNSHSVLSKQEFMNLLKDHYSSNDLNKNDKTKNDKPFWTAELSNFFNLDGQITGASYIPGTNLLFISHHPINGEDRVHVKGEFGHSTYNLKEPKVFIVDHTTGIVLYSNWCEENRIGFGKTNLKGRVLVDDLDGDGETDVWRVDPHHPETNGILELKTTLTDGQNSQPWVYPIEGDCREATTTVDFHVKVKIRNGNSYFDIVLDGEKYEFEFIRYP